MNKALIGISLLALVVVGVYLYKRSSYQAPTTQQVPAPGVSDVEEKVVVDNNSDTKAREITVSGNEFSFSPSSITVEEGERVRLVFNNTGSASHNFVVNELGIQTKTIPGGSTDTVEFTATRSGTFSFYCSVGNHRALGMEGEVIVE